LAVTLVVAFLVRFKAVLMLEVDPRTSVQYDMAFYDTAARALAAGKGLRWAGGPTAAWPPGYPALVALVYSIFGPSLFAAETCNALLGTATVGMTFLIAREIGRPRAGLLAAAILALFPGHVLFSPPLLSEALFGFLFCVALWLFLRWNEYRRFDLKRWFVFGLLLGAVSLVRGIGLLLIPAFALTWLVEGVPLGSVIRNTAAAALGLIVVLVPWTVRNQVMLGYPIMVATDGSHVLWIGNSPVANGEQSFDQIPFWEERFGQYRKLPPNQQEAAIARAETREALGYMFDHPGRIVALMPAKVYHLYSGDLGPLPWIRPGLGRLLSEDGIRRLSAVINAYYFAVLALAVVGVRNFGPFQGRGAVVLPIIVAWVTVVHAGLFFGDNRFHAPLLPVFSIMAAAELGRHLEFARDRP
jgi:4-amino-4-deoxy-L-arabinose transferase-like glycosyltransferase